MINIVRRYTAIWQTFTSDTTLAINLQFNIGKLVLKNYFF